MLGSSRRMAALQPLDDSRLIESSILQATCQKPTRSSQSALSPRNRKNSIAAIACAVAITAFAAPLNAQMTLPGSFEVSELGAGTYTIPIAVPPGTAGMQPTLSLVYSSQSGNGLLGVGWLLSGLPVVTRCPRTIVQDGASGGINHDSNDRFCIEGQRLVAISGVYGADQTEYRTEREGFSKIVSYGNAGTGPASFKVWTKSGQVMEFGATGDSRIEAQGKTTARLWAVNKISDTKGNFLSASYIEDNVNGEYRPARVDYTGNASASVSPFASVRFVYETRPAADTTALYEAGSIVKTTQRLKAVQTFSGETLVNNYKINYETASPPTLRSRVTSVQLCSISDVCLPAQQFTWQNGGGNLTQINNAVSILAAGGWKTTYEVYPGDYNGDGVTDAILFGASQTYFCAGPGITTTNNCVAINNAGVWKGVYQLYSGDYNGDGVTDVMLVGATANHFCAGPGIATANNCVQMDNASNWKTTYQIYPSDYNGDGITDLILVGAASNHFCAGPGITTTNNCVLMANASNWKDTYQIHAGDYNGDGLTDLVLIGTPASYFCPGPGITTTNNCTAIDNALSWKANYEVHAGDFNGDGMTDVFLAGTSSSHFCPGPGIVSVNNCVQIMSDPLKGVFYLAPGDYNGDGITDLFLIGAHASFFCAGPGISKSNNCATVTSGNGLKDNYFFYAGDYNGDGTTDFLLAGATTTWFWAGGDKQPDLMTQIANGIGAATTVTYAPLSAGSPLYTKESGSAFPTVEVQAPLYVVSQIVSSNGIGGSAQATYKYTGAKNHVHGRGPLGFHEIKVKDEETTIEQISTYLQDHPFTGVVAKSVKKLGATTLNETVNTFGSTSLGGGRSLVFLDQSVEKSWELSGTQVSQVTTAYQYDAYGNATQISVSTPDGYSKTTTNTFQNDTLNWLLGRLTRASVTSVTPN
jgi:hypothetical protein